MADNIYRSIYAGEEIDATVQRSKENQQEINAVKASVEALSKNTDKSVEALSKNTDENIKKLQTSIVHTNNQVAANFQAIQQINTRVSANSQEIEQVNTQVSANSQEIEQINEREKSEYYYGDSAVVPSDNSMFEFTLINNDTEYGVSINEEYEPSDETVTEIVIPYEYNGVPVTTIAENGFQSSKFERTWLLKVQKIVLPNTITSIKEYAFYGMMALTEINIPKGVTRIEDAALGNTILSEITFTKKMNVAECQGCFGQMDGKNLRIIVEEGVTAIPSDFCYHIYADAEIILPNTVVTIGNGAFSESHITKIIIPSSVAKIGDDAFSEIFVEPEIYYTGTKEEWDSIRIGTGNEYLQTATIHYDYTPATKNDVNKMSDWIKKDIQQINEREKSEYYYGDSAVVPSDHAMFVFTLINNNTEYGVSFNNEYEPSGETITEIVIPYEYAGLLVTSILEEDIFPERSEWLTSIQKITLPNTITSIGAYAFSWLTPLEEINIPEDVTKVGQSAFANTIPSWEFTFTKKMNVAECQGCLAEIETGNLKVTIEDGVTEIPANFVQLNYAIRELTIPNTVTKIGDEALAENTLEKVIIPKSVIEIGKGVFIESGTEIYYTGTREQWEAISIGEENDYLQTATIHYEYVPASKGYVDGLVGDVETALDNIIAIQNTLIGGETV